MRGHAGLVEDHGGRVDGWPVGGWLKLMVVIVVVEL